MSDIAEGIGAAVEGSLVGRAVEPDHAGDGKPTGADGTCLNCGADLKGGAYCQSCGGLSLTLWQGGMCRSSIDRAFRQEAMLLRHRGGCRLEFEQIAEVRASARLVGLASEGLDQMTQATASRAARRPTPPRFQRLGTTQSRGREGLRGPAPLSAQNKERADCRCRV